MKIYPILILSIFLTGCGGIGDREVFYKITAKINGHKNSDLEKSDIVITTPNYFTKYEDLNLNKQFIK